MKLMNEKVDFEMEDKEYLIMEEKKIEEQEKWREKEEVKIEGKKVGEREESEEN